MPIKILAMGWALMGAVMAQDCENLTKAQACQATMTTFCEKEESCGGLCITKDFSWCEDLEGTADNGSLQKCIHDIRWAYCRGTGVEITPEIQACLDPYLPVVE